MIEGIEQAEKYYRHYISPYLNKVFKDADGQFCEKSYSDHESDGATIAGPWLWSMPIPLTETRPNKVEGYPLLR